MYMGCIIIPGPERCSFSLSLSNYFPCMYSSNNTTSLINVGPVKVNSLTSVRYPGTGVMTCS